MPTEECRNCSGTGMVTSDSFEHPTAQCPACGGSGVFELEPPKKPTDKERLDWLAVNGDKLLCHRDYSISADTGVETIRWSWSKNLGGGEFTEPTTIRAAIDYAMQKEVDDEAR